jgi:hypothetical protein
MRRGRRKTSDTTKAQGEPLTLCQMANVGNYGSFGSVVTFCPRYWALAENHINYSPVYPLAMGRSISIAIIAIIAAMGLLGGVAITIVSIPNKQRLKVVHLPAISILTAVSH